MDLLSGISDGVDAAINATSNLVDPLKSISDKVENSLHTSKEKNTRPGGRRPHLPVLIIPGFMSSGLTIEKSHLIEDWEGQRLWLNLKSLGLEKYYDTKASRERNRKRRTRDGLEMGTTFEDDDDEGEEDQDGDVDDIESNSCAEEDHAETAAHDTVPSRNLWIKHISLSPSDLKSDPAGGGIQVRPMEGLAGVDYLTPGTLTNFLSYVFAPVITALQKQGYENGTNLDAAPYDWRLAPMELEKRDGYFTNTMKKVEEMYEMNGGMPVVLVCHSLGCRVAHYFLDFAFARDESWCEKYIHTYMPVGAPHLGAPFAFRGLVSGDKMGLDAFLTDSEVLTMIRTLGSIPWLIPSDIPSSSPANAFVRCEGAFEININSTINVGTLFERRVEGAIPEKLELVVRHGKRTLTTKFVPVVDNNVVHFEGKFIFSTGPDGPYAKQCCNKCRQCCILKCACVSSSCSLRLSCLCFCTSNQSYCV